MGRLMAARRALAAIGVIAGALALAMISLAPAAAQEAPSALEFYAGQPSAPAIASPPCKGRRCRATRANSAQVDRRPLDIRTAPQIVAEAARYIGTRNPMHFAGPGCKAFVNMIARRAGYAVNASMRAFDTRGMGVRVASPQPGDYRVTTRKGGGHVDIVAEVHGSTVTTINGNKGRNRVGWSHRPIAGAAYYRPIRVAWVG